MALTPEQAVDTANEVFGSHPGHRALHAKGVVLTGTFTPTADASSLTCAPHMQGPEVPVTVRFSNGSGDPGHPDWAPDPRGLAVKFYLPDGSRTDIVAVSSPRFPTRTPEGFVELLKALAGPAAAWRLPVFLARHPETIGVLPALAPTLRAPASYATIPYYGLHAFRWIDAGGGERHVRYKLRPAAGVARLSPWAARRRERDYLQQEIVSRAAAEPVLFSLEVQIAGSDDPVDDPSASWPKERKRLTVGALKITGPDTEREQGNDLLVFDPSRVTEGIECTADPVLRFRPAAYSESIRRRTEG
ncbi:MAG TPA: catalase family peroxidase [Solirubrobacteraceae bacterium]|jgi:catalase